MAALRNACSIDQQWHGRARLLPNRWATTLFRGSWLGRSLALPCIVMSLLLGLTASAQEKKKPLAIEDLYLMESVKSPTLFPQEQKLVYERVWIDAKTKQERHALWLVEGKSENRKPLEKGEPDGRSPVVSPDGEWIAFLSTRPRSPETLNALARPPVPPYSDPAVDLWLYHVKTE